MSFEFLKKYFKCSCRLTHEFVVKEMQKKIQTLSTGMILILLLNCLKIKQITKISNVILIVFRKNTKFPL